MKTTPIFIQKYSYSWWKNSYIMYNYDKIFTELYVIIPSQYGLSELNIPLYMKAGRVTLCQSA